MGAIRIGCSGWAYDSWRDDLYEGVPARARLERYAEVLSTVEVNASFYRLPAVGTVRSWVQQTPEDFVFAIKVSRYLTHVRRLREARDGLGRLLERIEPLIEAERLGPLLWQLPPGFARDDERLDGALRAMGDRRHALEFRDRSWFAREVADRLRDAGVALVVADDSRRELPRAAPRGDWGYLRLHYGARGRRGNYSPTELDEWAARLRRWRRGRELFVYFNNDWEGFAVRNALDLRERLAQYA